MNKNFTSLYILNGTVEQIGVNRAGVIDYSDDMNNGEILDV